MNYLQMAQRIPSLLRKEILEQNLIYKSAPISSDKHMQLLYTIYCTYIDPGGQHAPDCHYCLQEALNGFKELLPVMLDLQKAEELEKNMFNNKTDL